MRPSLLVASTGCAIALAACGNEASQASPLTVTDSAGVRIVTNTLPEALAACPVTGPRVTIGELDGPEEQQLYQVWGARRLGDGRIVLMNRGSHELRFYDGDGVFLNRVGREGRGPGEFRMGHGVWVLAGDTLWVGDHLPPWGYHVFDSSGVWVRTVQSSQPFFPQLMAVLEDGSSVTARWLIQSTSSFSLSQATALLHGPAGETRDTLGTYPMGRFAVVARAGVVEPFFEPATSLDAAGRRIYVGDGSQPEVTVFEIASDGARLAERVRWNPRDRTVHETDLDAAKRLLVERAAPITNIPTDVSNAMREAERPVPELFPVFSAVVANRAGGFWVRRYERPGDPDGSRWLAFDAEGRFTCEVTLPPGEIVDLGSDYLLAKQIAELGIEQVVMYGFEGAAR